MISINYLKPPEKKTWFGLSIEDRQKWRQNLFIAHPQIQRILADFALKLEHCERAHTYQAMLIIGGTGAGKTTLTRRISDIGWQRYHRDVPEKTICPVLQFRVPDPCTPFEFSVSILKALGEERPRARKNRADTIEAAEKLLHDCEVKIILIDNFQDIPERRSKRGIELVGSRLRNLIDATSAVWVFLGTEAAKTVINSDDQLIRRVGYSTDLRYFSTNTISEKVNFRRLLVELDKWLPLTKRSCLTDPKMAMRMFLATEGIFDRIIQIVDRGWVETVESGREFMDQEDLEKAFVYVYGPDAASINPFSKDFVIQSLRQKNQPFEHLKGGESC
jgi:hypothetical protein